MFSSRSFIVSGLILKFFIYFAFILAYGVRYWFSFITLNYVFFPTVCSCLLCFRLIDYIRGFISELSAICLVCVCVCVCTRNILFWLSGFLCSLKSGSMIPQSLFFLKMAVIIWSFLWLYTYFRIVCSNSVKKGIGILVEVTLNL